MAREFKKYLGEVWRIMKMKHLQKMLNKINQLALKIKVCLVKGKKLSFFENWKSWIMLLYVQLYSFWFYNWMCWSFLCICYASMKHWAAKSLVKNTGKIILYRVCVIFKPILFQCVNVLSQQLKEDVFPLSHW